MQHFEGGFEKKELQEVNKLKYYYTTKGDDRVGNEIDSDLVRHAWPKDGTVVVLCFSR